MKEPIGCIHMQISDGQKVTIIRNGKGTLFWKEISKAKCPKLLL